MSKNSKRKRDLKNKKGNKNKSLKQMKILSREDKLVMWFFIHFPLFEENLSCDMCRDCLGGHCKGYGLNDDNIDLCAEASLTSPSSSFEMKLENNRGGLGYSHISRDGVGHIHIVASDQEVANQIGKKAEEMGYFNIRENDYLMNSAPVGYC